MVGIPQSLRLPKREDAHFLSLIAGGALVMTIFVLFVGSAGHSASYAESQAETLAPSWRQKNLQRQLGVSQQTSSSLISGITSSGRGTLATTSERTLVVYLYSQHDPVHKNNLNFFIKQGVDASAAREYVFVVQAAGNTQIANTLPRLPVNARWFYSAQRDCEMGLAAVSELFQSGTVKKSDFTSFVIVNSAVRGPFLPSYALEDKHWTQYFTQRLNERTKLVGPTISCEPVDPPEPEQQQEMPPYVQFTALATDLAGLNVLEANKEIFSTCYATAAEARVKSEMAASEAILKANFTLDSFMARYRKVDWTDAKSWGCNSGLDPLQEFNYDGSSVHPFEIMFVPMTTVAIENGWSFAKLAALYETWARLQDLGENDVRSNLWVTDPWPVKRQRIAYMQSRGPGCFDNRYYLQKNPDLKVFQTVLELWDHFVMMGQFEGRSYRWSCEDDRKLPWE